MHSLTIGCDLDDTIIDHMPNRRLLNEKLALRLSDRELREPASYIADEAIIQQYIDELYGRLSEAAPPFKDSLETLRQLVERHEIYIISKRLDPPPAQKWVANHLSWIPRDTVFFTNSNQEKIDKIVELNLDIHIDDKPSVLSDIPGDTEKILFDPLNFHEESKFVRITNWADISEFVRDKTS